MPTGKMIIETKDGEITYCGTDIWSRPPDVTLLYSVEVDMKFRYMGKIFLIESTELYFQGAVPFIEAVSRSIGGKSLLLFGADELLALFKSYDDNRNQAAIEAVVSSDDCTHLSTIKRQSVVLLDVYVIVRCTECGVEIV